MHVNRWCHILYTLVNYHLGREDKNKTLWEVERFSVMIFQNAAALEVSTSIHKFFEKELFSSIFASTKKYFFFQF